MAAGFIFLAILIVAILPTCNGFNSHGSKPLLLATSQIWLAMHTYAQDHHGQYPQGKSSTEVFQKLIDEEYVGDPTIFYYELPGKLKPTSNRLKPENVSWDLSTPRNDDDSDSLPIIFLTGYKIQYFPGGSALPLSPNTKEGPDGIAVAYEAYNIRYLKRDVDGTVREFVPATFNTHGKTYLQLTPEGPLSP